MSLIILRGLVVRRRREVA